MENRAEVPGDVDTSKAFRLSTGSRAKSSVSIEGQPGPLSVSQAPQRRSYPPLLAKSYCATRVNMAIPKVQTGGKEL